MEIRYNQVIEDWRIRNKYTQKAAAKLLGLSSQQAYNEYASGRKKDVTLEFAVKFLHVTKINLLTEITRYSRETEASENKQSFRIRTLSDIENAGNCILVRPRTKTIK